MVAFPVNKGLPNKLRISVWNKGDGKCVYCGSNLDEKNFTVDHIYPRSLGGDDKEDNLAISCRSCNSSKKDQSLE